MFKSVMPNKMRWIVKNTHEFIQYIHIIHIVFHCDSVKNTSFEHAIYTLILQTYYYIRATVHVD